MGYIGPGLEFGAFQKIDDISSGFNGSATQFNVQIGGTTAEIASLNQLIISISGVIQEPNDQRSIQKRANFITKHYFSSK